MKAATRLHQAKFRFHLFQSTPPVKAATLRTEALQLLEIFQSTPPVKAATIIGMWLGMGAKISIHAAREGGDSVPSAKVVFLCPISIHAAREGGDRTCAALSQQCSISIHAAREGGDTVTARLFCLATHFNPRRP